VIAAEVLPPVPVFAERPIIFSGPMVRVILAGTKTQTRRIVRIDDEPIGERGAKAGQFQRGIPTNASNVRFTPGVYLKCDAPRGSATVSCRVLCPYGSPGDRLWLRESIREGRVGESEGWVYDADAAPIELAANDPHVPVMVSWAHHRERSTCPSRYMPRWASRITLQVVHVRIERLQSITEEDARAEGIDPNAPIPARINGEPGTVHCFGPNATRGAFALLWDAINAKRATWVSNPFVWVLEFRRL